VSAAVGALTLAQLHRLLTPRPVVAGRAPLETWDATPAIPVLVDWLGDSADADAVYAALLLGRYPPVDRRIRDALLAAVEEMPRILGKDAGPDAGPDAATKASASPSGAEMAEIAKIKLKLVEAREEMRRRESEAAAREHAEAATARAITARGLKLGPWQDERLKAQCVGAASGARVWFDEAEDELYWPLLLL
jgi:hypothetical protein